MADGTDTVAIKDSFLCLEVGQWTPIAHWELRQVDPLSDAEWVWAEFLDGPISIEHARWAYDQGKVEVAQRRVNGTFLLVVLRRRQPTRRIPYFGADALPAPQTRDLKLGRD